MSKDKNIVVFGAGAIGTTVACWLSQVYENTYLLARGEALENIQYQGALIYQQGQTCDAVSLKTIEALNELETVDIIVVCVKNYSLEGVLQQIKAQVGDRPVIVGIQNGIENQEIIPEYFSKMIFGVAQHNAWIDKPGEVGFSEKVPLIIGTSDEEFSEQYSELTDIFSEAMPVIVTNRIRDAAHNKLLANLINSILSLTGKPETGEDLAAMQEIFISVLMESIRILKANGVKEFPLEAFPPWRVLQIMSWLPRFMTRKTFHKGISKVHMTSMQQDVLTRSGDTELDSINGALLSLAKKADIDAPFSKALYEVCREHFRQKIIRPMRAHKALELLNRIVLSENINHNEKIICREGAN